MGILYTWTRRICNSFSIPVTITILVFAQLVLAEAQIIAVVESVSFIDVRLIPAIARVTVVIFFFAFNFDNLDVRVELDRQR